MNWDKMDGTHTDSGWSVTKWMLHTMAEPSTPACLRDNQIHRTTTTTISTQCWDRFPAQSGNPFFVRRYMRGVWTGGRTVFAGGVDHLHVRRGVVGLDVGVDGLLHQVPVELRRGQLAPHRRLVAVLCKLVSPVQVLDVLDQHLEPAGKVVMVWWLIFFLFLWLLWTVLSSRALRLGFRDVCVNKMVSIFVNKSNQKQKVYILTKL